MSDGAEKTASGNTVKRPLTVNAIIRGADSASMRAIVNGIESLIVAGEARDSERLLAAVGKLQAAGMRVVFITEEGNAVPNSNLLN